jgi:hypothetical protein
LFKLIDEIFFHNFFPLIIKSIFYAPFELLPVAKYFLIENKLKIKKVNFRIAKNDLIPLIISILYNWKKFLVIKNMKQVIKYIF